MNKYRKFLEKNFPKNPNINNKFIYKIYDKVCENNIMVDIFIQRVKDNTGEIFLKIYKKKLNLLLLYIAFNDEDCINYCLRSVVENFLRFVYWKQTKEDIEKVNNQQFRFLNETIKSKDRELYKDMKNDFEKIFSYYGLFSKEIHGKDILGNNGISYLEDIISTKHNNINKIYNHIVNIVNDFEKIMMKILNLNSNNFSGEEIIRMGKFINESRIKELIKINNLV